MTILGRSKSTFKSFRLEVKDYILYPKGRHLVWGSLLYIFINIFSCKI